MSVIAISGLGNPGPEYQRSRHNLGFLVVEDLAAATGAPWQPDRQVPALLSARAQLAGKTVTLLKPLGFMNRSGEVLGAWSRYFRVPVEQLAVVYDDITLEPGRLRITLQGGAGGHNGVADLLRHLGSGFVRFRVGIGPKSHPEMDLADFVLSRLPEDHARLVQEKMPVYREALISLVQQGPVPTMNQFNQRTPSHD